MRRLKWNTWRKNWKINLLNYYIKIKRNVRWVIYRSIWWCITRNFYRPIRFIIVSIIFIAFYDIFFYIYIAINNINYYTLILLSKDYKYLHEKPFRCKMKYFDHYNNYKIKLLGKINNSRNTIVANNDTGIFNTREFRSLDLSQKNESHRTCHDRVIIYVTVWVKNVKNREQIQIYLTTITKFTE